MHLPQITFEAFLVVMREGTEAVLALLGLELFLIQATSRNRVCLYLGAGLAVFIGLPISAVIVGHAAQFASRFFTDWLELFMLVMAWIFLLAASAFLAEAPAIEPPAWTRRITAYSASRPWLPILAAFVIVYREGMEATIFLLVLNPTIDFDLASLLLGVQTALVCLIGMYVALRYSARTMIMVRPILIVISGMLFLLGLHYVGESVGQLQKLELIPATDIEGWLDFLETQEAAIAQAIAGLLTITAAVAIHWPRKEKVDADRICSVSRRLETTAVLGRDRSVDGGPADLSGGVPARRPDASDR
jgi:high-affinity Fe2+/Pb2+ permease